MISTLNSDPLLRNMPVGLTPQQVTDPYRVLDNFFSNGEYMPNYRRRLKRWLITAIDGGVHWKRNKLIRCIYTFISIAQLLDALWLINQSGGSFTFEEIALRYDTEEGGDIWTEDVRNQIDEGRYDEMAFHPDFLTREEEKAPYEVIRNFFKGQDLFDAKENLSLWCHTTVANHYEGLIMDRHSLISIFEQINKLIEAVFIINEIRTLSSLPIKAGA